MKKEKRVKIGIGMISVVLALMVVAGVTYRDTIFQEGNPLPYVPKMISVGFGGGYQKVFSDQEVYITKASDTSKLKKHLEETYHVRYEDQMGRELLFSSETTRLRVEFIPYFSKFEVWKVEKEENVDVDAMVDDIIKIKVICGEQEEEITKEEAVENICSMIRNAGLEEYTGDDVMGFTTVKLIAADGTERTISLTSELLYCNGKRYKINTDLVAGIRKVAESN